MPLPIPDLVLGLACLVASFGIVLMDGSGGSTHEPVSPKPSELTSPSVTVTDSPVDTNQSSFTYHTNQEISSVPYAATDTSQKPQNNPTTKASLETTNILVVSTIQPDHPKGSTNDTTESREKVTSTAASRINTTSASYVNTTVKQVVPNRTTLSYNTSWMNIFLSTHHFEGQYMFDGERYPFDFVVRYVHPYDSRTLVTNLYDADGALLEFNGTCKDGYTILFKSSKIYTPGVRFPLNEQFEITGSFPTAGQPYFSGNFTKPINTSLSLFYMNKGLGAIETGDDAGTRTAIIIIIPTSIAFLGVCGTVAIVCWASKKGYLRGRHKSYRLFTDAHVSYESEAETVHI